ncbi:MinD-like ATPase involved in chromosome partitioning or flagellar assembly [Georgenia satyanarayanai]|uniref:MinD-like ATPase involved in chromosome partitioning or flagellar assembly n=1 Tax=Georgenia satyanarayanai TaxID=860221 RepID=A0A2Y9AS69_9MICO|nr:ATPase [Georgenia satyanarayanai]PYF96378.1 MinD-like ATPase involved in chromosome partitioning or flagellar assembly [Georgenia satyanarayanai]SSA46926.1 MinD-like ATPase involved in chromosome partitioning or flagellar assembly [Georgenia satyanarayanai]
MTTKPVAAWPRIHATTREDGSGEVIINGTARPIETSRPEDARAAIVELVTETAAKVDRPVRLTATGPDGTWPLIVHPDGTVEADEDTEQAPPRRTRRRQATTAPDPTRAQPATREPANREPEQDAPTPTPWGAHAPAATPAARRSFLTSEQTEEPATKGARGLLTRLGVRVSPSEAERSERADEQAVSQHWPGPRTIAIVNGKGGASKTPSTILLSAIFARYGGAGVLAWDNNQTRGTLGWRTEQGPHDATLLELLPQTDRLLGTAAQSADLAHYVHHQTRDRFDVLRSKPMALAHEQRVEPGDVDAIHAVAAKYYRLIFIDSGNDESDPMWLRMIDHADQIVVATTTRDDHAEAGALLLEALAERDERGAELAAGAVVIVSQADPKATTTQVDRIADGFQPLAREAVTVPFDPAMVDGLLRLGALNERTRRAWLHAAAAVARGL